MRDEPFASICSTVHLNIPIEIKHNDGNYFYSLREVSLSHVHVHELRLHVAEIASIQVGNWKSMTGSQRQHKHESRCDFMNFPMAFCFLFRSARPRASAPSPLSFCLFSGCCNAIVVCLSVFLSVCSLVCLSVFLCIHCPGRSVCNVSGNYVIWHVHASFFGCYQ